MIEIKRSSKRATNSGYKSYTFEKKTSKLYVEGTLDLSNIVGLGASISAGYQVNKWVGFGLSGKSTYILLQVPSLTFNSRTLDYRLDFDANRLYFHFGYVSSIRQNASERCGALELDKSKPHAVYGVSFKHYAERFLVFGLGIFYTQIPNSQICTTNVSSVPVTFLNNRNIFEVKLSAGLYAPSRLRKIAVKNQ